MFESGRCYVCGESSRLTFSAVIAPHISSFILYTINTTTDGTSAVLVLVISL